MKTGNGGFEGRTWWFRLQNLLADSVTGLPTLTGKLGEVREALEKHGNLCLLYVNVPRGVELEKLYGWSFYDEFLKKTSSLLTEFKRNYLGRQDFLLIRDVETSEFVFFIAPGSGSETAEYLDEIELLRQRLLQYMSKEPYVSHGPIKMKNVIHVGCSQAKLVLVERPESSIHYAIEEAKRRTFEEAESESTRFKKLLREVISNERVSVRYQPIIEMRANRTFGFEALSYTEGVPGLEDAEMLFNLAEESDLSVELNRLCRRLALSGARGWPLDIKVFLNTDPRSIEDIGRDDTEFLGLLQDKGVKPESVVLEITERSAITKLVEFKEIIKHFREIGVRIAIDDAGAGYASLNTIASLRPDFLKFDIGLVRGIDKDRVKQELLTTLQNLARKVEARIIAEGIETENEYNTLLGMGVELGQGYFISPPRDPSELKSYVTG
ncbi:MAG: EAL domain-containing protein [Candidatus Coatesbacteria bacterium]|nr:MAG: EAL domain-containing protein [Candidatus Coatesbacteria bacterium]